MYTVPEMLGRAYLLYSLLLCPKKADFFRHIHTHTQLRVNKNRIGENACTHTAEWRERKCKGNSIGMNEKNVDNKRRSGVLVEKLYVEGATKRHVAHIMRLYTEK